MVTVQILTGDSIRMLARRDPACPDRIGAVVTDPPYGIGFMGSEWDQLGTPQAYEDWCLEWLRLCRDRLGPGGRIGCFTAARMVHRLRSAMIRAGFVQIETKAWTYLSGYPKFLDLLKPSGEDQTGRLARHRYSALKPAWEPILIGVVPPE